MAAKGEYTKLVQSIDSRLTRIEDKIDDHDKLTEQLATNQFVLESKVAELSDIRYGVGLLKWFVPVLMTLFLFLLGWCFTEMFEIIKIWG